MGSPRLSRAQRRELRSMQRRLRELDRADERARAAGIDPYEAWLEQRAADPRLPTSGSAHLTHRRRGPRRRRRVVRAVIIIVLAVALPIGAVTIVRSLSPAPAPRPGFPPAGVDAAEAPLGEAAPPPAGSDHYQFTAVQRGEDPTDADAEPVTWDPCRPLHYATNGIAPAEGQEILASAFKRVEDLTGFTLINDGPTSEPPRADMGREPYQPDRYGERWAPILVAWTTPDQVPDLAGDTIGLGGSIAASDPGGHATYVTGVLFLDRPQIEEQLADTVVGDELVSRRALIRSVMLHEIGHILGLDHVGDPNQLMYPISRPTLTDFAAGDLRGLYRLATGPCAPGL